MAKTRKKKVNKSAAIREYQKANPHAGPTEVVQELGKKGIKVTVALASNVKANAAKKKTGKKKKSKKAKGSVVRNGHILGMADLLEAKKLVHQAGGFKQAKAAVDALQQLQ